MTDIFARLSAPFPPDRVSWRVGSTTKDHKRGMALAYIDARDVMERLDEVVGPEGWQDRYPHANGKTICEIGIKVGGEWIWKSDGAGDTDFEAEKGAISSAFKRAAVKWGIGRYLYDVDAPWVSLDERKQIVPAELTRLRSLLPNSGAADARDAVMATIKLGINMAEDLPALQRFWTEHYKHIEAMPDDVRIDLTYLKDRRKAELSPKKEAA